MLGHVELVRKNTDLAVRANPPHIARLPGQTACLCGFRSPDMDPIFEALGLRRDEQPDCVSVLPSRVLLDADEIDELANALGYDLEIAPRDERDNAAWQIANFGRRASDILEQAEWQSAQPNDPTWTWFDPRTLRPRRDRPEDGHYFLSFGGERYGPRSGCLWRRQNGAWERREIDRRWGRYLALRGDDDLISNILKYDEAKSLLAVPRFVPLPWPFGRALAMCSGFVPVPDRQSEWDVFKDVPVSIARLIARKLGQDGFDETEVSLQIAP